MKNLKTFALLFCCVVTLSTFAVNPNNLSPNGEEIQKEIAKLLDHPSLILEEGQSAQVHFLINQNGEIVVIDVDTQNDLVEAYIKNRLNYQKLAVSKDWFNRKFSIPVNVQIR